MGMQLDGLQSKIWTSLPGQIISYDAAKRTASVQVTIQAQKRDAAGKWVNVTMPPLLDCPVSWPRGGGYGCTFPLAENDEGMVHFSARCIDAWWQSGGIQPQAEFRMHDLSDGMFVPGICSVPNVPAETSENTARFWAEDGSMYVELDKNTGSVRAKAPTKIVLDAPTVEITGDVAMQDGDINLVNGDVTAGVIKLKTHRTSGVTVGPGTSGPPVV